MSREILVCNGKYALSRIIEADRDEFVELQRQINGDGTFYLNPKCKDMMWEITLGSKKFTLRKRNCQIERQLMVANTR